MSSVCRKLTSVLTALVFAFGLIMSPAVPVNASTYDEYITRVVQLVNEQRAQYGLSPMKLCNELNSAAAVRANELTVSFSHTRPDGRSCFTAFAEAGVRYSCCAENIAWGYGSPEAVVSAWLGSSGHRANILSPNYEFIGVGVINSGGTMYWVQDFASGSGMTEVSSGSPSSSSPSATAGNNQGASGFIERLYTVALGRSSDPSGAAYWLERVNSGNATGADLARGFLYSQEFLGKNTTNEVFVDTLYRTFFNREPDASGRAYWLGRLASGASRQQIIEGFINSVEWYNLCSSYGIRSGSAAAPA